VVCGFPIWAAALGVVRERGERESTVRTDARRAEGLEKERRRVKMCVADLLIILSG